MKAGHNTYNNELVPHNPIPSDRVLKPPLLTPKYSFKPLKLLDN